jgi:hypothetical protein
MRKRPFEVSRPTSKAGFLINENRPLGLLSGAMRSSVVFVLLVAAGCAGDDSSSAPQGAAGASGAPLGGAGASAPVVTPPRPLPPAIPSTATSGLDDDAGTLEPAAPRKAPPDPTITFDWQESGSSTAPCEAGRYVGTFMCTIDNGGGAVVITGPVALTLTKALDGEFLEISDGSINGFALLFLNFASALTGRLDCSSRQLAASAVDGMVGFGDAELLPVFDFEGQLQGTLDAVGATLSGEWTFPVSTPAGPIGTCIGPWTATREP